MGLASNYFARSDAFFGIFIDGGKIEILSVVEGVGVIIIIIIITTQSLMMMVVVVMVVY